MLDGVWAVFSWSYRSLSTSAAWLFRLIGHARDANLSAVAAAALAGVSLAEVRRTLRELTETGLLAEP